MEWNGMEWNGLRLLVHMHIICLCIASLWRLDPPLIAARFISLRQAPSSTRLARRTARPTTTSAWRGTSVRLLFID